MLVSVIIPTYNSEKFIIKAINSVLNQTYQQIEIIIIDDGSTDNTKELVERIQDDRVKYFYQENAGVSVARNKGISLSNGELIAFLDADDEWHPIKLEKQVNILKINPNIGLVFCPIKMTYEKDGYEYIRKYRTYKNQIELLKYQLIEMLNNIISPSTVIVKKSLLDETGYFDNKIKTGEDRELWLRLGLITEFSLLNEVLVECIKPQNSLTSTISVKNSHKSYLISLNKFFRLSNIPKKLLKLKNKAYSSMYLELGILSLLKNKDDFSLKNVLPYVIKSYKKDPIGFISEYRKIKFMMRTLINAIIFPVLKKVF